MIERKPVPKYPEHKVSIINISSHQLTDTEYRQFNFGLSNCFLKQRKNVTKDIPVHT